MFRAGEGSLQDEIFFVHLCLEDNCHLFHEEGVFNYSTMLLREDVDLLLLGAREAVYALDLRNISKKLSLVGALLTMHLRPLLNAVH